MEGSESPGEGLTSCWPEGGLTRRGYRSRGRLELYTRYKSCENSGYVEQINSGYNKVVACNRLLR